MYDCSVQFTGKERDTETGNDDFGARYFSPSLGRWLSPDWSAVPAAVPYADLTNPQTLNLYAMVSDNPETFADLDGHGDDGFWDTVTTLAGAALGAWLSDNAAGILRPDLSSTEGKAGQSIGDFVAQQTGIAEVEFGASLGPGSLALAGGGQEEALALPAGFILHGTLTAGIATTHLAKSATENSSGGKGEGPKAKDAPGVSAGGQATDEHGNKLGPSGEPMVNKTRSNTRERAKNRARNQGSRTVEHRTPKQGDQHFHPADIQGKKKPSSTHHEYPN